MGGEKFLTGIHSSGKDKKMHILLNLIKT